MDFSKLSLSDKIIGGTGLFLVIDLLFFPWHSIDLGPFGSFSRSAIESPNGFWGLLALILTILVLVVTGIRALSPGTSLPELPISYGKATFFVAIAIAALLVLKLLLETEALGFGCYLGIISAAGMVYGGFAGQSDETSAAA